jgi:phosphoribosylanthranilate isomerase
MFTQIYETSTPPQAAALSDLGVDHIGILIGDGSFPRELPLETAASVLAAIKRPSRSVALFLTDNIEFIVSAARALRPDIVHLGAPPELFAPDCARCIKQFLRDTALMRSIPVVSEYAVQLAIEYEEIVDFLLLDSHKPGDLQVGARGVTHDWRISQRIVKMVKLPVILAGGLGPDNVANAIRLVRPAGVDSKTKTDAPGSHIKDLERVRAFQEAAKAAEAAPGRLIADHLTVEM